MSKKRKNIYFPSALFLFALLTGCSSTIQKQVQITESVEGEYVGSKTPGRLALKKCMETTLTNNDLDQYFLSKGVKVVTTTKLEKPIEYKFNGFYWSAVCMGKSYILEGSESLFKPLNDDKIYRLNQEIIEKKLKEDLEKEEAKRDAKRAERNFFFNRGNDKRKLKDYYGAIADYTKSIELNTRKTYDAYLNRGRVKSDLDDDDGAIADFSKAIEIMPDNNYTYYLRAEAKLKLKMYEESISDFDKAIELNPQDYISYWGKGEAEDSNKQYKQAILSFTKSIKLCMEEEVDEVDLSWQQDNLSLLYSSRADSQLELENLTQAMEDYDKAIELNSTESYNYLGRGNTKQSQKNFKGACEDWKKAAERGNEDAEILVEENCK